MEIIFGCLRIAHIIQGNLALFDRAKYTGSYGISVHGSAGTVIHPTGHNKNMVPMTYTVQATCVHSGMCPCIADVWALSLLSLCHHIQDLALNLGSQAVYMLS